MSTLLKFVSCRQILTSIDTKNDKQIYKYEWRLFYAGSETCFLNFWWILHLLILIFITITFIYLFIKLKNTDIRDRNHLNFGMRTLIYSFHSKYWYWEFLLLSRRILIA